MEEGVSGGERLKVVVFNNIEQGYVTHDIIYTEENKFYYNYFILK